MLFFKRILDFSPGAIAQKEKRRNSRFAVGPGFPAKAVLNFAGRDGNGDQNTDGEGQDWGGWLVNLSGSGASLQLHPAALAKRGEAARLRLKVDGAGLEIPGSVAHFRTYANYALCGVALDFPDELVKKSYLQLLEPVVIGASFKAVDSKRVRQDTPDLRKEQYQGDSAARLTVWRSADGIAGFDLQIGSYSIAGSNTSPELDVAGDGAASGKDLSEAEKEELRRLFQWIVPNLAKAVPADVRKFVTRF